MQVNSVTQNSVETSSTIRQASSSLDKDAFLRLLVEQLKNQDPTNPQDSSEFMAQMAQFSILEQLTNLNDGMDQLKQSQEMTKAAELLGRQVSVQTEDGIVSGLVEKVIIDEEGVKLFVDGNSYSIDSVTAIEEDESANQNLPDLTQIDSELTELNTSMEEVVTRLGQILDK